MAVEHTSFPRLEKQGVIYGLSAAQLACVSVAFFALALASVFSGLGGVWKTLLVFSGPLALFGIARWDQRPFITLFFELGVWIMRTIFGQRKWRVRPEKLVEEGKFGLPGIAGTRLSSFTTSFGEGALIWDSAERTATAVIQAESTSFAMADEGDRAGRVDGFSTLCAQAAANKGVVRVALHARTLPASTRGVAEYYERTVAKRHAGPAASLWAHNEAEAVFDLLENRPDIVGAVRRDVLVAITISEVVAASEIKDAGGGKRGMSYVMAQEVADLMKLMREAGAERPRWMDATEVAHVIREAYDPEHILEPSSELNRESLKAEGPVVVDEEYTRIHTDSAFHQTYWIAEWPRTQVESGFLTSLVANGEYTHTVTLVFTPVSVDKALRQIKNSQSGVNSKIRRDQNMGRPLSAENQTQLMELKEREYEIVDGYTDVSYTGYVTISGSTERALGEARSAMKRSIPSINVRLLAGQQSAAFVAAALPVGWSMK